MTALDDGSSAAAACGTADGRQRYPPRTGRPGQGPGRPAPPTPGGPAARPGERGQLPGRASAPRRLSVMVTFAPASGGTTTSCAAGTPPARSGASTGTIRLIRPSPTGPSSKCRAADPTNPTVVSSRV